MGGDVTSVGIQTGLGAARKTRREIQKMLDLIRWMPDLGQMAQYFSLDTTI